MSIFGIGISGLQVAQTGMQVTQHNIANSSTDGYTRQSIIQTPSNSVAFAYGFMGNGVKVTTIQREYNDFLTGQVREAQTQLSSLEAYSEQINIIDNLVADSNAGVSPALQSFFSAVQQVSAQPASLPARQSMVSAAQALVSRFQGASQRIGDLYAQVNVAVQDNIDLINNYARQIAALNQNITSSEAAVSQPANDLRDQRDQLVGELNKLVKVETIDLGQGGVEVLVGKGQLLVMGGTPYKMKALKSDVDPAKITVALDQGGGAQVVPEGVITGGRLGGLLQFRSESLDTAMNSLGKVAASVALTFNAQHKTGMDLLGNSSGIGGVNSAAFVGDFFTLGSPKVVPLDGSYPPLTVSFDTPTLNSKLSSGNYFTNITNSNYTFSYDGSQYTVTRLSDNSTWTATTAEGLGVLNTRLNDITDKRGAQGINLSGSGFAAGQSYTIFPTRDIAANLGVDARIVGDVRLVAAAIPVRMTTGTSNTGTMKFNVERVRDDAVGGAPTNSPTYPLTINVSSTGQLTIPAASPNLTVNVIDVNGNSTTTTLSSAANALLTVGSGNTFEIWDGTRRILLSTSGSHSTTGTDTFTLNRNDSAGGGIGVSDGNNMVLLGKLLTQRTSDGATNTFQASYAQMVADVGNKAREVDVTRDAQQALVDQATATKSTVSGVNLDEEAANLLKFQQLYQAAARSITVGQKLFDELLTIARG